MHRREGVSRRPDVHGQPVPARIGGGFRLLILMVAVEQQQPHTRLQRGVQWPQRILLLGNLHKHGWQPLHGHLQFPRGHSVLRRSRVQQRRGLLKQHPRIQFLHCFLIRRRAELLDGVFKRGRLIQCIWRCGWFFVVIGSVVSGSVVIRSVVIRSVVIGDGVLGSLLFCWSNLVTQPGPGAASGLQ